MGPAIDRTPTGVSPALATGTAIEDRPGANMSRAVLVETNLSEADLFAANLERADLSKADLTKADLRGASMRG